MATSGWQSGRMRFQFRRKYARRTLRFQRFTSVLGLALVVASLIRELRLPPAQRMWHGALFGRIPYDWRPPTPQRMLDAFWQPRSTSVVCPTVFGLGWSVNLAALLRPIRHAT
jgi:hypothetical protein